VTSEEQLVKGICNEAKEKPQPKKPSKPNYKQQLSKKDGAVPKKTDTVAKI